MSEGASRRVQDEHDRIFHCRQEGHFIRNCPQLVGVETSEVGIVSSTPGSSGPSQAGRGGSGRSGSIATGRGRGRVQEAEAVPRLARYRVVLVLRLGYIQSHSRRQMNHQT